jgi:hypothetical protein
MIHEGEGALHVIHGIIDECGRGAWVIGILREASGKGRV